MFDGIYNEKHVTAAMINILSLNRADVSPQRLRFVRIHLIKNANKF